jgi:hypothetical protein
LRVDLSSGESDYDWSSQSDLELEQEFGLGIGAGVWSRNFDVSPAKVEKIVHIGDFTVSDGNIVAADPCQKSLSPMPSDVGIVEDSQGAGQPVDFGDAGEPQSNAFFSNCAVGSWHAFVEDDTADAYKLIAIYSGADAELSTWTISLGDSVTSLSGQVGLFDKSRYHYDLAFYEKLCDLTARNSVDEAQHKLAGLEAWCFDWGAVSATALGDGNFLCYTMNSADGTTVGIAIDFYRSYTAWADISLSQVLVAQG